RAVDVNLVDGDRATGHERDTPRAHGLTFVRQPGDAKEYVRAVGRAHLRCLVGIGGHPVADALHRHFFARDEIALDEHAPDGGIGVAVVGIVIDAQRRAVFEDHAGRALDLNRQRLEWIPEPAEYELLSIECPGLDRAAIVIRHDLVLFVPPADKDALV